jgi:thiosulfate reductase cytochrome b subunit
MAGVETVNDPDPIASHGAKRLHPLPIRIMHWINAATIFIMVGSGWKIYDDSPIFGWLTFADPITIGRWAQHGLQWHFFGMWLLVLNGLTYLTYGLLTGRYRRMLLPIRLPELLHTISDSLHFRLAHDDVTEYNPVQKVLYIGVICVGIAIVVSGLAIWKPIQFAVLVSLLGGFQSARIVHFVCMTMIVGFVTVHVALAILVPKTIVGMIRGGPYVNLGRPGPDDDKPAQAH